VGSRSTGGCIGLSVRNKIYPMIIWDGGFMSEFLDNRSVVITGRLGSGKTLLAVELAEQMLKRGYRLITNIETVWNDNPAEIKDHERVIGIMDEGGMYVRTAKTVQTLAAFLRKTKSLIVFSGKKQPHEDMCDLKIYLWFDAFRNLLIPIKVWRWDMRIQSTKRYHGFLFQTGWQKYYGIYSTEDPGDYPETVVKFFEERAKKLFKKYGRNYKIQDVERGDEFERTGVDVEFVRDLASLEEAKQSAVSVSTGESRRGQRRK